MRFVITLLVPALKKSTVIRMILDQAARTRRGPLAQLLDELGNPLAFAHEGFNLVAAQSMSKPAGITSSEDERARYRRGNQE